MQTIERILMVDGSVGQWTDAYGKDLSAPEFTIGIRARLRIDLRQTAIDDETGFLLPLDIENVRSDSFYIALDSDFLMATDPKLLKLSGISVFSDGDRTIFEAEIPNTAVPGLVTAADGKKTVPMNGEMGGFSAGNDPATADYAIQFSLSVRGRVWMGGAIPADVQNDPEYYTAAEVRALIESHFRPEKGDDGAPGAPGKSAYEIAVAGGYAGTEAQWLESLGGIPGKSAYEVAKAGGYAGTEAQWLESLRGATGKNAYELACGNGYKGTLAEWIASLKGERGDDMHFDATGELAERAAYDGERAGFTFAAAIAYQDEHKTELYIYVKRSDEWNDWCTPVVITYFARNGKDGDNVALIPPLEFKRDAVTKTCLSFSLGDFPAATIAAIFIDQADGALRLPYDSARGIQKIIQAEDGTVYVYFGTMVPEFETGRIYFAQGASGLTQYQWYLKNGGTMTFEEWVAAASLIAPAPKDGNLYGMQDGEWTEISGGTGTGGGTFDQAGTFAERHVYDDAAQGFKFFATDILTDSTGREYQAIYQKCSSAFADWSDAIRFYAITGKDGKNGRNGKDSELLALIPDYEFEASDIVGNALKIDGIKPIAAVELYDEDGNGLNIDRSDKSRDALMIRTCYAENHTIVYLGGDLDVSRGGRVRFAQGMNGLTPYGEYVQSGGTLTYDEWLQMSGHIHTNKSLIDLFSRNDDGKLCFDGVPICTCNGSGNPTDPDDPDPVYDGTMYYGYIPSSTLGSAVKMTEITTAMVSVSTVIHTDLAKLDKVSIGVVPAGSMVVILLPLASTLTATKFDGIAEQVPFAENNGMPGTGANGIEIAINGQVYRAYGEFKLIDAELFIYIN